MHDGQCVLVFLGDYVVEDHSDFKIISSGGAITDLSYRHQAFLQQTRLFQAAQMNLDERSAVERVRHA